MMKKKTIWVALSLLLALPVAGCSADTAAQAVAAGTADITMEQTLAADAVTPVSTDDLAQMAEITLTENSASVQGDGVTVDGSTVTITQGGVYTLSGSLADGQILIDAGKMDTVELILDGVSITSSASAAIYAKQAALTVITLAEGTDNTLTDAEAYVYPDAATDEPSAALYAQGGLTIRGAGALMVYGNSKNGITSKGDLVLESGSVSVQAENNGLRGKGSVAVLGGTLTVTAGNDGIQTDNATDTGKGTILVQGGELTITAAQDGLQAQTGLTVTGGTLTVVAGGGYTTESDTTEESYKALKAEGTVTITGGIVSLNNLDDAIHAGEAVVITGGQLSLMSRDDGIHSDHTVSITGGMIDILISYEGIEGKEISVGGGAISLVAADDGINAADSAASGQGDRMGGWSAGDSSLLVSISGGSITINAYGDGIDSNGSVVMTGGELYISSPVSSGNGAIDYDSSFQISGGILAAAGAVGMAQTPDQTSAQPSIMLYLSQAQQAGATYLLVNDSGTVLLRYAPEKEFQSIVFSAPELALGSAYHLYESTDGTMDTATLLYDVTLSSAVSSVGALGTQTMRSGPQQDIQPQQNNQRRP